MRLPSPPLLVITDRRQARRPLDDLAAVLFASGCRWLSLREKDLPPAQRLELLHRLAALARPFGAIVGVHEDLGAAAAAGLGAVHLPDGASAAAARIRLGSEPLIGVSAHDAAGIARAASEGADYVTLSPIFPSASKPGYGPAVGLDGLAAAARGTHLPVIALGGIDEATIAGAVAAGAAGIAVMGAVMATADPAQRMTAMIERLRAALAARDGRRHDAPR